MIKDLVDRAKKGDNKAEEQLFEHLIVRFRTFVTRNIWEGDIENVASEAGMIVLEKYKDVEFSKGFEAWAHGILKYVMQNHIRKLKTEKSILVPDSEVESRTGSSSAPNHESIMILMDCLEKIFEAYPRYALVLNMANEGYDTAEICKELDIRPTNCYAILNRSRGVLRRCLETGRI